MLEMPNKSVGPVSTIFDELPGMAPKKKAKAAPPAKVAGGNNKYEWGVMGPDGTLLEKCVSRSHAMTRAGILGGSAKRLGPVMPRILDGNDSEPDDDYDD